MSSRTGKPNNNNIPAHLRFQRRRQEKKRKRKLRNREKQREIFREREKVNRYLFKEWLREQYRRKKIPWQYFRRYSINHQCYLWMIELGAGILSGDHSDNRWIHTGREGEGIFSFLFGYRYHMGGLSLPPSSYIEISQALKSEARWMERQDMRQIIAICLLEAYGCVDQLPWAEKGKKKIGWKVQSFLWWTMREIVRERYYRQKHNIDDVQDGESAFSRSFEETVLLLQLLGSQLNKNQQYHLLQLANGFRRKIKRENERSYIFTMKRLHAILKKEKKKNRPHHMPYLPSYKNKSIIRSKQ